MLTTALIVLACCAAAIVIGMACTGADCLSCESCKICSNSATACTYTVASGTADLSVPGIVDVTASNTIVTIDQQSASGTVEIVAEVAFTPFNINDVARLHIKYQDSSNSWYAEALAGPGGYVKLYERVSGTSTQRGSTYSIALADGDAHTLKICYANNAVVVKINGLPAVTYGTTTNSTVQGIALSTGTVGSLVEFVNTEYVYGYNASTKPDCPSTCWPYCSILCDLEIEMSGWAVGSNPAACGAAACQRLNAIVHLSYGTYAAAHYCSSGGSNYLNNAHGCYWDGTVANYCFGDPLNIFVTFGGVTDPAVPGTRLLIDLCAGSAPRNCLGSYFALISSANVSESTFDCATDYGLIRSSFIGPGGVQTCGNNILCSIAGVTATIRGANG